MRDRAGYSFILLLMTIIFITLQSKTAEASVYLDLKSQSAILIEQTTGKVLYTKDENQRIYPASTTKILTALVALEYLDPDEIIVVGNELKNVPYGSSLAYHKTGESITVRNLIRALLIPSGNDTANVIAMAVAKRVSKNANMNYVDAERVFCGLMNEKAKSLGVLNSNFVNPHGYHDPNHYSTAADIAKLSVAAMENQLIKEIVGERTFAGNGAGNDPTSSLVTTNYSWKTHNELLLDGKYSYMYATGIKTGFTDEAGYCVTASAERDDKKLIAVVMNASAEEGRWEDSIKLFDFGFSYFNFEVVQKKDDVIEKVPLAGYKLGESDALDVVAELEYKDFFSKDEINRIKRTIEYDAAYVDNSNSESVFVKLKAPIEESAVIGTVTYTLGAETIFKGALLSGRTVEKRTLGSDANYYVEKVKQNALTLSAVPYWAGGTGILILLIIIVSRMRVRRDRNPYSMRRRY